MFKRMSIDKLRQSPVGTLVGKESVDGRTYCLRVGKHKFPRWEGDTIAGERFEIFLDGREIGSIFHGYGYPGWFHHSLHKLRSDGERSDNWYDPTWQDSNPVRRFRACFSDAIRRAEAILAFRRTKYGY